MSEETPAIRDEQGHFKPGCSGNPQGRPKSVSYIRELAQKHSKKAIRALVDALRDPKLKVAAASALLDRGYGRPAQAITGADGGAVLLDFSVDLTRAAEGNGAE